ncbi:MULTISPECIES: hypothetical protein [Aeromonas]|uniref:hypothetical protein n=1 Tax=Aeromonas TaxID=642 RepID=UPI0011175737|nr:MULTISPECIES: hypothetical protein [Aeromonas]MBJ7583834.1 hypothetical protein [Aeromonas veronii]MBJ7592890.1 hypothetical protein [Aeromonas veronii]MCV3285663.1 hypothetical protein [Aeromonas veronii]QWZ78368.1 hypothetical protein I6L49_05225 [Aeromonas sp. FDAARGOS 1419]QWZ78378.1 hypothetical protein I6L49_05280 [Aeromonas sp. FDAARGOS 1419]
MSGMTMVVNALQVRFGRMDEQGQEGFEWANMHVVEDELQIDSGFAGVNIGKLPLDTQNGNKLAKDLHAAARAGGVLPGFIEVTMAPQFSMKQTKLVVVGWKPVSQSAPQAKAS